MLGGPVVRVVGDAGGVVDGHLVLVQDPVEGGAGAELVVVGAEGDAGDRDVAVVEDAGLVFDLPAGLGVVDLRVAQFLDAPGVGGVRVEAGGSRSREEQRCYENAQHED